MNEFSQIHEIYHHGTKGQKWGLRRALWYPISAFKKSQTAEKHPLKPKAEAKNNKQSSEKSRGGTTSSSVKSSINNQKANSSSNTAPDNSSVQNNTNNSVSSNTDIGRQTNLKTGFRLTPTAPEKKFSHSEKKLRDKILSSNNITEAYKNKNLFSTQELTDILTRSKAEQDMEDFIKKNKSANAKAQAFLKNTNLYTANAAALLKNTETIYKSGKTLKDAYDLYKKVSGKKSTEAEKTVDKILEEAGAKTASEEQKKNFKKAAETVARYAGVNVKTLISTPSPLLLELKDA